MISGYCFNNSVTSITVIGSLIVVGGNFNFLHFQHNGNIFKYNFNYKYGHVLSLENNGDNRIFVGFEKGIIMILDIDLKNNKIFFVRDFNSNSKILKYFNYLSLLFTGSNKNINIQVYNKDGNCVKSIKGRRGTFPTIFCHSIILYSANKEGSITIWDIDKLEYKNFIRGDGVDIVGLESFRGNLISCTDTGIIRIRDESNLYSRIKIETLFNFSSMTLLEGNICIGTKGGIIKFYDIEGRHFKDKVVHDGKILVMKSFNDQIYSGSIDGKFKILDF